MFVLLQVRRVFTLIALLEVRCTLTLLALLHTDTNYACKHTHTRIHTQINHTHTHTKTNTYFCCTCYINCLRNLCLRQPPLSFFIRVEHQVPGTVKRHIQVNTITVPWKSLSSPNTWHSEQIHTGQLHYRAIEVTVFAKYQVPGTANRYIQINTIIVPQKSLSSPNTWHSKQIHTGQHHYSATEVTVFTKYLAQ